MKDAIENMNQVWSEVSSKMYERVRTETPPPKSGPGQEQSQSEPTDKKEEDIQDADFEVVDDNKK